MEKKDLLTCTILLIIHCGIQNIICVTHITDKHKETEIQLGIIETELEEIKNELVKSQETNSDYNPKKDSTN